jgi:tRNA (adenine22-N1)-methyltransferase
LTARNGSLDPSISREANERLYAPRLLAGKLPVSTEMLIRFGPYLLEEHSSVWHKKWEIEIDKLEKVCRQVAKSELDSAKDKLDELNQTISSIKEVLVCTQMAKPSFN